MFKAYSSAAQAAGQRMPPPQVSRRRPSRWLEAAMSYGAITFIALVVIATLPHHLF
jgi:hypothetical protein